MIKDFRENQVCRKCEIPEPFGEKEKDERP